MCRGFDRSGDYEALKIKAFYVRLLISDHRLSDFLTLHFPARINGGPLEVDGASIRSDAPAFLTLHRVVLAPDSGGGAAVYGARERLRVAEGSRFEIYAGDVRVVRGTLRKDEDGRNWRLDCKASCGGLLVSEADVWVETAAAEAVVRERVKIGRRRSGIIRGCGLEEIPEQRECEYSGCCCGGGGGECDDGKASTTTDGAGDDCEVEVEVEVEVEGVRWAVDVGIWVACLGVGYLVSKASRNNRIVRRLI